MRLGLTRTSHGQAPVILLLCACLAACNQSAEDRGRNAVEKIKQSIPDREARALEQEASPERIRLAQEALVVAREYMGEVNGKLDSITVNAIEAFQRRRGLQDDGILTELTVRELEKAKAREKR